MSNKSFIQKGKKSRNELYLPALRYIVVDDWTDKIGHEAFVAWLKFHSWVDRRDEERKFDRVPYTLEDIAKKLNISKSKLYRAVIIPLWEHWLIDLVEYDDSNRKSQKPKNIIVYESPQNKHETEIKPLEKLRDWKKDYGSMSQVFGRRGGRPKSQDQTNVHRFKNETVYRFKNETVTVSKMKPNNYTNKLITNTNKPNNESNNHHHSESEALRNLDFNQKGKSNDPVIDDDDYLSFRELFLSAGADDIKRHDLHYPAFEQAKKKVGLPKLLDAAKKYIAEHGELSQIVAFLAGAYQQFLVNRSVDQQKLTNANKLHDLPQAVQQAAKEQTATVEDWEERQKRIAEKLAAWEAKKEEQRDSCFE